MTSSLNIIQSTPLFNLVSTNKDCWTDGNCIYSDDGGTYRNNLECVWNITAATHLRVDAFDTENYFDKLKIKSPDGSTDRYHGEDIKDGPRGVYVEAGTILEFSTDSSYTRDGFQICGECLFPKTAAPTASPIPSASPSASTSPSRSTSPSMVPTNLPSTNPSAAPTSPPTTVPSASPSCALPVSTDQKRTTTPRIR